MNKRSIAGAVVLFAIVGMVLAGGWWQLHRSEATGTATAAKYHCPMHPSMVSDRPGDCPICGMRMVPIDEERLPGAAPRQAGRQLLYRSTMNPNEVSDRPGKDSMGMEMVPVEVEPSTAAQTVAGRSSVRLSDPKRQLIGVKTSLVTRAPFARTIRAVGRVTFDETRLHHVHTKVAGYVEALHADATGELVHRGQPLLEIYSPELLASQQEYLVALRARSRTAGSELPSISAPGEELVASVRRRLELLDVSADQIRELESSGRANRTVTLYAPMSGTIVARNVTHGEKVEPETSLLDLADLTRIWVIASVYEYELPFVGVGQRASMTLAYLPGRNFQGTVTLVYPVLDAATRTVQVRLEFPNPDLVLKPDMYAEVALTADLGQRLGLPDTAVIDTGGRSVVFVDRGEGLFEPREIAVGLRLPDRYEVLSGVAEGERVLTSGNFYVDSESKLKAALAATSPEAPQP